MSTPSDLILQSAARSVAVRRRITPLISLTPMLTSRLSLPAETKLHYKCENFQHTGSFKLRGATAKLTALPLDQAVITASTGNHGIASSHAAQQTGHQLTVALPETVVAQKRTTIEAYGTQIILHGTDGAIAEAHARQLAKEQGQIYVSPYNDLEVIAGQGTCGLEMLDQLPQIDNLFIAMGGGGLISGIGAVMKAFSPTTRVIGASAVNTAALAASITAGEIVETEHLDTLADGVAGGVDPGSVTLPLASEVIDEVVHIGEDQIIAALRALAWTENMIVEGAAALALAPLLAAPERYAGQVNVVLLCGANYDSARIKSVL